MSLRPQALPWGLLPSAGAFRKPLVTPAPARSTRCSAGSRPSVPAARGGLMKKRVALWGPCFGTVAVKPLSTPCPGGRLLGTWVGRGLKADALRSDAPAGPHVVAGWLAGSLGRGVGGGGGWSRRRGRASGPNRPRRPGCAPLPLAAQSPAALAPPAATASPPPRWGLRCPARCQPRGPCGPVRNPHPKLPPRTLLQEPRGHIRREFFQGELLKNDFLMDSLRVS